MVDSSFKGFDNSHLNSIPRNYPFQALELEVLFFSTFSNISSFLTTFFETPLVLTLRHMSTHFFLSWLMCLERAFSVYLLNWQIAGFSHSLSITPSDLLCRYAKRWKFAPFTPFLKKAVLILYETEMLQRAQLAEDYSLGKEAIEQVDFSENSTATIELQDLSPQQVWKTSQSEHLIFSSPLHLQIKSRKWEKFVKVESICIQQGKFSWVNGLGIFSILQF